MKKIFEELVDLLIKKKLTIATAESLTGGLAASSFVDVSGASKTFKEAFITYCDEAKIRSLDVPKDIIEKYGAISKECAYHMAKGAARKAGVDAALSFTGNAGPEADEGKAVGLVYIGLYFKGEIRVFKYNFKGSRADIRSSSCLEGAKLLLSRLDNS